MSQAQTCDAYCWHLARPSHVWSLHHSAAICHPFWQTNFHLFGTKTKASKSSNTVVNAIKNFLLRANIIRIYVKQLQITKRRTQIHPKIFKRAHKSHAKIYNACNTTGYSGAKADKLIQKVFKREYHGMVVAPKFAVIIDCNQPSNQATKQPSSY